MPQWGVCSSLHLFCSRADTNFSFQGGECSPVHVGVFLCTWVCLWVWSLPSVGNVWLTPCCAWTVYNLPGLGLATLAADCRAHLIPPPHLEAWGSLFPCMHTQQWMAFLLSPFSGAVALLLLGALKNHWLPAHWGQRNPKGALSSLAGFSSSPSVQGRHRDRQRGRRGSEL